MTQLGRVAAVPSTAQEVSVAGARAFSGKRRGSIIWPSTPSASTTQSMRHFWESSKAFMVKSHISWTVAGARTMLR